MEKLTFSQKLLKSQKEIGPIKKDSENPFFKSTYFDINAILAVVKPVLNNNGLILTQALTTLEGGKMGLKTCISSPDDSVGMVETLPLPECTDSQKFGSAVTYFRRYALQSMLALEAEDDDGNDVSEKKKVSDEPFPSKNPNRKDNFKI